ncbi:MAG TPA: hypothetical protein VGI86_01240 [Acidimicrobiia bacterium]
MTSTESPPQAAASRPARPPRNLKRTIIIVLGALLALNFAIIGVHATRSTTATPDLPSGILELFPPRGQLVRPQDQIGAQLAKGWTGELTLDSTPLPDDRYDPIEKANNAIIWRPGPGKAFTQTEPGDHTLTLHFWPIQVGPSGSDSRTFSWTFKVG